MPIAIKKSLIAMLFRTCIFPEPKLEFGDRFHHPDPRHGLLEAGPLQSSLGDAIEIAVVGSSKTVSDARNFMTQIENGIAGKTERHPNLHPDFPGLRNQNPFRCRFKMMDGAHGVISKREIDRITKEPDHECAVTRAVETITQCLETLETSGKKPHVALIALPVELIERVWRAKVDSALTQEAEDSGGRDVPDFRGKLKAAAMRYSFPIQIVWEDILDRAAKIPRKIKETTNRKTQDQADMAWNLLSTLYYKGSGRVPWRRLPDDDEFRACYIGISFYRATSGQHLWTSAAQMFDERGRGFILKGSRAHTEAHGRHPYLTEEDAENLVQNALTAYKNYHKHYPARVITLKTSRFRDEEADGISSALDAVRVELPDLVWVQESCSIKVLREGDYPVLRGTFVELDGKGLLYTNGSIPYYGTYPGQYLPKPILLCPHAKSESTIEKIAHEVFTLTKVNWNSTQMNQKLPIPIRAARKVGEVLKYVPDHQPVSPDYRRYI